MPAIELIFAAALAFEAVEYNPTCTAVQYFDISSLQCGACPDTQVPATDGYSCACDPGTTLTSGSGGFSCVACPSSEARTEDGTACLPCGASTLGYQSDTQECLCPDGLALQEYDSAGVLLPAKICMACADDAFVGADQRCTACPAQYMTKLPNNQTGCECEAGYLPKEHLDGLWGRDISCMQQAPSAGGSGGSRRVG